MKTLARAGGELRLEGVALAAVAAQFGTPCYVYSRAALEAAFRDFDEGLAGVEHLVCYAVKANSNLAVLDILARLGAGFDKSHAEIDAALDAGIKCFNVESEPELERLDAAAARMGKIAPVSLRINPDVDARTHPYISTGMAGNKFGIPHGHALEVYGRAARMPNLRIAGIDCHIGSQILETGPLDEALERVLELVERLRADGIRLEHVDLGGGFGIRYRDEDPLDFRAYGRRLATRLAGRGIALLLEPGRAIAGNAGLLLTRVEYLKLDKAKRFAVVDASMSELIRPALYGAWHDIVRVDERGARPPQRYDVVGPVCESTDVLGVDRDLAIDAGDLLAILSAGAYAMVMSSNYNTRPRPAEVLVDGTRAVQVRARETIASLFALESRLPAA